MAVPKINAYNNKQKPAHELITPQESSAIYYREHGSPHPLIRWHYHQEYELHLITHGTGKVFVGDYIGNFYPNQLILTGPNLPHNWISQTDSPCDERDKVVTFEHRPIELSRASFPEVSELAPLLQRARFGIEFTSTTIINEVHLLINLIAKSNGLQRLSYFLTMMSLLAKTTHYKLLSSTQYDAQVTSEKNQALTDKAVNFIVANYKRPLTQTEVATYLSMQTTYFSRFFRQATGRRFVEFVTSLRIARACDLMANSHLQITAICFEVGFTNISNFNRQFHKLKNMTPSEYRKCLNNFDGDEKNTSE